MSDQAESIGATRPGESPDESSDEFARWLRAYHSPAYSRRTAERHAAFFLPHLKPGMQLLDVGCGPGSITVGLAKAISPGAAIGVDLSPEAAAAATAHAANAGCTNATFREANAYELPFADSTFDAVFMHALLQHLNAPEVVVAEAFRVLRPGGVLGVADADYGGSIIAPSTPALEAAMALSERMRRHSGGDIHVGSRLRELLAGAGFTPVTGSATAMAIGDTTSAEREGEFSARYFEAPELGRRITAAGWATSADLEASAQAWRAWGASPGAYWARFWCEAVGPKPGA